MTETEFLVLADVTLREIEMAMDNAAAAAGLDIECTLSGNVLEIELVDNGSKIIINRAYSPDSKRPTYWRYFLGKSFS